MTDPFEKLARVLFEELERLGPSAPDAITEWDKLTSWERGLYINGVERLFEERELIKMALESADNDSPFRGSETKDAR